ncbi:mRNA 3' end processing factor [Marasmius tenuissimus]|nr:mRNA 3' end processing factor [Marasmius tenuissimus]
MLLFFNRRLVEAGVSQEELVQTLSQLCSLMRTATQPSPPPPQHQPQPVAAPSWSAPATFATLSPAIPSIPTVQSLSPPLKTELCTLSSMSAICPPVSAAGFADLLSSLLKSGVVSANGTPLGAGSTQTEEAVDYERETSRSYRRSILDYAVQLSTVGLTRLKELEDHLDMDFRQVLKANQNIGRGHGRSWFVGVEGRADRRPLKPKAAAEVVKRDAELQSHFIAVPPGDRSKTILYPASKEILGLQIVEDDEEWAWKNAKKDGRAPPQGLSSSPESKPAGIKRKVDDDDTLGEPKGAPRLKKMVLAPS